MKKLNNKGFTLIEILIVIAIIGILALVVFVALNPAGRFADARNSTRQSNVESIGRAIVQYQSDNGGAFPPNIPTLLNGANDNNGFDKTSGMPDCTYGSVVAGNSTTNAANGCMWADDSTVASLIAPKYLASVPTDSGTYAHYFIALTPDQQHIIAVSDSMDTNGVTTNTSKVTWYYKSF